MIKLKDFPGGVVVKTAAPSAENLGSILMEGALYAMQLSQKQQNG